MTVLESYEIKNGKPVRLPKEIQTAVRKAGQQLKAPAAPAPEPSPPPVPALIRVTRRAAVVVTASIAATSFILSFAGLRNLAEHAGISPALAWLWPLTVDGTICQATMAIIALAAYPGQRHRVKFFWAVLVAAAAVSVGGNMLHALISGPLPPMLAALVAMIAPLSLLATTHGLAALVRFDPSQENE